MSSSSGQSRRSWRSQRSREVLDSVPEEPLEIGPRAEFLPNQPALLELANEALTTRQYWLFALLAVSLLASFYLSLPSFVSAGMRVGSPVLRSHVTPKFAE